MRPFTNLVSIPRLWDLAQAVLGAPAFKKELYRSKLHPPGPLLDFGCATAHLAEALLDFEYYGVDLEPSAIEAARRRYSEYPQMRFLAVDIRSRPFPSDFFAEILFAGTVHHVTDGLLREILSELSYCLKPGGTIHVFDPVYREGDGWSQKLMRKIDQGKHTRTVPQIRALIEPLRLYEIGEPTYHRPYGALLQDCDFVHLPLTKRTPAE